MLRSNPEGNLDLTFQLKWLQESYMDSCFHMDGGWRAHIPLLRPETQFISRHGLPSHIAFVVQRWVWVDFFCISTAEKWAQEIWRRNRRSSEPLRAKIGTCREEALYSLVWACFFFSGNFTNYWESYHCKFLILLVQGGKLQEAFISW